MRCKLRFGLVSQPSPPPPPLPMDFSYEFLTFQYGNHDTNEKLEYYQSFIMRLLGELKTLRETACTPCQQKCSSSKAAQCGNQLLAAPDDSTPPLKRRRIEDSLPRMPKTDVFLQTPASASGSPATNEKTASDSSFLVEMPTGRKKLCNKSNDCMFYAERDALSDPMIDVTFVDSFPHENSVHCVSLSPDGRYLAVGTGNDVKDGSIVIYEVEGRKRYCELREYATQYGSYVRPLTWNLCFSSEGRYLAVVDRADRIIIWDVPKKRLRSIFLGSHELSEVRFSPDGRLVAFWTDTELLVLSIRDNSTRRMATKCRCFDFSPGGRLIATEDDGVLIILDVRTGKAVKRWNGYGRTLSCMNFTLDGRGLLCVYTDMIQQWDVSDVEPVLIRKFNFQTYFYRITISPDHRLLAYSDLLLDVNSGRRQCTVKGHSDFIYSVDFSAAGTYLAIGSNDGSVSLWKYYAHC